MINKTILEKFIEQVLKRLSGDWLIVGGSVISLVDDSYRVTLDIDLVKLDKADNDSQLEMMQIAEDIGLPVEAINLAAPFFVNRIPDVKENLILIAQSKQFTLYRPNFYLYLQLKSQRMSETDMEDCLRYFALCKKK